jgi:hypothetical protein
MPLKTRGLAMARNHAALLTGERRLFIVRRDRAGLPS